MTTRIVSGILSAGCLLLAISLAAQTLPDADSTSVPWSDQLSHLQQMVSVGEAKEVRPEIDDLLDLVQTEFGNYHQLLINPLLVSGDAHMQVGNPDDALGEYTRALQINRTEKGFHAIEQQPILRRAASAYLALGNFQDATRMYEQAYEVALHTYGATNPLLLQDVALLLDWYERYGNHYQAAILSRDILYTMTQWLPPSDPQLIEVKRAFAEDMRNVSFPPQREFGTPFFRANLPLHDYTAYRYPRSLYQMGASVLTEVVETLEQQNPHNPLLYSQVLLDLADYYQVSRFTSGSFSRYRQVWDLMAEAPQLRERTFSEPKLLFIALPTLTNPSATQSSVGHVELALTISNSGRVTGRKSLSVYPRNDQLEFIVRNAAKHARYRPAFVDREPVGSRDVIFTHFYPLSR